MIITLDEFRKKIELSLVNQYLCDKDIFDICQNAKNIKIGVICANPTYVKAVKMFLENTKINISANVGFPFGTNLTEVKVFETKKAIVDGANQIDMVMNVGALKSQKDDFVYSDIKEIVREAKKKDVLVKVIIESWVLNEEEKIRACKIVESAGADILKTTTGVKTQYLYKINSNPVGATVEDIVLFRSILGRNIKIKASGGIYDIKNAIELLKAGADQLGVSKGLELINEFISSYGNCCEV
jgi:deoxyribose-phosphate aldolase